MNERTEAWLVRVLRPLAWLVLGALSLLVPVCSAVLAAQAFGTNPWGLGVALVLALVASLWWSRVILTFGWWLRTGAWAWQSTGLLYSIRTGWGRR